MRFGLHTIIWGAHPASLPAALRFAKAVGFEGIEFFQHPEELRSQFQSPAEFRRLVEDDLQLVPVSFCSGNLEERMEFCRAAGIRPSALSQLNSGIDRFEFTAGVIDLHLPVDTSLGVVNVSGPSPNLLSKRFQIADATPGNALASD